MNGIDFLRQKAQDNHPFKVVEDADMIDLRKSIEENGVLEPAIAFWNEDNELELATGHRRKYACSTLGYETMPILIKNLSRDEATILMGESNIQRRQDILPSEKGFAYKMMLDAMKRQGKRSDLTDEKKVNSREELAQKVNESSKQIYRFIKITVLIKPLLDLVDAKRIALRPAVEIAELPKKLQNVVFNMYSSDDITPSYAQAHKMSEIYKENQKGIFEQGILDEQMIIEILSEKKGNQKANETIPITRKFCRAYFPNCNNQMQVEEQIIKMSNLLRRYQEAYGVLPDEDNEEIYDDISDEEMDLHGSIMVQDI